MPRCLPESLLPGRPKRRAALCCRWRSPLPQLSKRTTMLRRDRARLTPKPHRRRRTEPMAKARPLRPTDSAAAAAPHADGEATAQAEAAPGESADPEFEEVWRFRRPKPKFERSEGAAGGRPHHRRPHGAGDGRERGARPNQDRPRPPRDGANAAAPQGQAQDRPEGSGSRPRAPRASSGMAAAAVAPATAIMDGISGPMPSVRAGRSSKVRSRKPALQAKADGAQQRPGGGAQQQRGGQPHRRDSRPGDQGGDRAAGIRVRPATRTRSLTPQRPRPGSPRPRSIRILLSPRSASLRRSWRSKGRREGEGRSEFTGRAAPR